jgi:hypothetical protein
MIQNWGEGEFGRLSWGAVEFIQMIDHPRVNSPNTRKKPWINERNVGSCALSEFIGAEQNAPPRGGKP